MSIVVTIYTSPGCQPCRMTKHRLDKLGIHYTEVPIINGEFSEAFAELELTQAPVVCASVDGVLYRMNPKGEAGIFMCEEHAAQIEREDRR